MFVVLRWIIGIAILFGIFVITRKNKFSKQILILSVIILSLLIATSSFFPIENIFLTFSSPEKAYQYMGYNELKVLIEGENSCFAIDSKGKKALTIFKIENGYKINTESNTKIKTSYKSQFIITVYKSTQTNECYIEIFNSDGGENTIFDSCNSQFIAKSEEFDNLNQTYYTYYAYITDKNDYWLSIDGQVHKIDMEF